jgi:hypothetical protein
MNFKNTTIATLLIILSLLFLQVTKAEESYMPVSKPADGMIQNDFSDYMKMVHDKV